MKNTFDQLIKAAMTKNVFIKFKSFYTDGVTHTYKFTNSGMPVNQHAASDYFVFWNIDKQWWEGILAKSIEDWWIEENDTTGQT